MSHAPSYQGIYAYTSFNTNGVWSSTKSLLVYSDMARTYATADTYGLEAAGASCVLYGTGYIGDLKEASLLLL